MTDSEIQQLIEQTLAQLGAGAGSGSLRVPIPPEAERLRAWAGNGKGHGSAEAAGRDVARLIDHTLLKSEATEAQVRQLCDEARRWGFASVCVNPAWVPLCAERLQGSEVLVCTVIGFPLGATTTQTKAAEVAEACASGAREVDMVLHVGALVGGDLRAAHDDIRAVAEAAHAGGAVLKVIIETALLTDEQKVQACVLADLAGAAFVKTSTGFAAGGATVADVALMRRVVGARLGVKASGGIRTLEDVLKLVEAGATRIGASAGVRIVEQATGDTWDASDSSLSGY